MSQFKVGDTVRATPDCHNDFEGGEGIVHAVSGDNITIMCTKAAIHYSVGEVTTSANWGNNDEVIIIKEGHSVAEEKVTEFKVGDIVLIGDRGCSPGCTVRITSVGDNTYYFKVEKAVGGQDPDHQCHEPKSNWAGAILVNNNEEEKTMGRRTFRQVKESNNVQKGGVWQEECDDGDQPYVLIDRAYMKASDEGQEMREHDRNMIEMQPQWYVEVFKVTPEYMTQPELDQFEAFKKTLTPARKTRKAKNAKNKN